MFFEFSALRKLSLLLLASVFMLPEIVFADSRSFDRYAAFARSLEQLGDRFDVQYGLLESLIKQREELLKGIRESDSHIAQIQKNKKWHNYLLMETQLMQAALNFQLQSIEAEEIERTSEDEMSTRIGLWGDPRGRSDMTGIVGSRALDLQHSKTGEANAIANASSSLQVRGDALVHHIKTLNVAGQLTVQRRLNLVLELNGLVPKMVKWRQESLGLLNQYWELADIPGFRSNVEIKSGLVVLQRAAETNLAADLAEGILLMRLEKYSQSREKLSKLVRAPFIAPLALAARAELNLRTGDEHDAKQDWQKAFELSAKDSRLRVHRAVLYELQDKLPQARREWQYLLQNGGYELWARRALALINPSLPNVNERLLKVAEDHAVVATKLSDNSDWASELALACIQAAQGEKQDALKTAERAAEIALGDKQLVCLEFADDIANDKPAIWQFGN